MTTDTIADTINRLITANKAKKATAVVQYSKFIESILSVLKKEGFVGAAATIPNGDKKFIREIEVELLYKDDQPKIEGARRMSIPSKRMYIGWQEAHPVRQGFGRMFVSTPKGVLTDREVRKEKVGGEVLFIMW